MSRILVIEDNPANLHLMTYLLHADGHTTCSAEDGVAGIEQAAALPADIIVCDVHLPRLDGYGVARTLKADDTLRQIPLVAVTALAMVGDQEKVLAAGFDGYISKPINPRSFARQVCAYLPGVTEDIVIKPGAPPPTARPSSTSADICVGPRILVVDDSPVNWDLARATLAPSGYRVTAVASVAQACRILENERFDLVLSDVHMPIDGGLQLLALLKIDPRWKSIPVILISSSTRGTYDRMRSEALGADRFLLRPLSPLTLLAEISTCLCLRKEVPCGAHPDR